MFCDVKVHNLSPCDAVCFVWKGLLFFIFVQLFEVEKDATGNKVRNSIHVDHVFLSSEFIYKTILNDNGLYVRDLTGQLIEMTSK